MGDRGGEDVELLREVLPTAVAVDHIGSTSVPGLPAKDCLDLMVQVDELEDAVGSAFVRHGYRLRPEPWNRNEVTDGITHRKLVFAGPRGNRAVNIQVRIAGGRNVRHALLFRGFLRADEAAREAWGAFKTRLAASVPDLSGYGQIKATGQPLLMRAAEHWATETGWGVVTPVVPDGAPVLGVDGCRAGWVGALLTGGAVEVIVSGDIGTLVARALARDPGLRVVAVDIPIGLPDDRPRSTDVLARLRLPTGRRSSVFPTPSRAAAAATTYAEASATNRASLGRGLSRQAFQLVPKILDVDRYVRADPPVTVLEAHPEVSFAEMDSACVVPAKTTAGGASARRAALATTGLRAPAFVRGQGYAVDDLLDACAVAWTARRYAAGSAYSLPDPPERFSDGLRAAIWV